MSLKASRPAQMAKSFGVFDAFPEISKSSRVTIATVIKSGLPIAPRASCGLHRAAAPAFARGWQRIVVRRSPLLAAPQTTCSRPGEAASPSRPAAALHRSKNSQNAAHFVASGWWMSVCRFWLHVHALLRLYPCRQYGRCSFTNSGRESASLHGVARFLLQVKGLAALLKRSKGTNRIGGDPTKLRGKYATTGKIT